MPSEARNEYDIIAPWQDPLDFEWDCLPKWKDRYIAMDENGSWLSYASKPQPRHYTWGATDDSGQQVIPKEYHPKNYTGTWQDSLHVNPKYKDA